MAREAFIWSEIEMWTLHDVRDTMQLCATQDEADEFLTAYSQVCDHAEHNVCYMIGLISDGEEQERLADLFGIADETIQPMQVFNKSSCGVLTGEAGPVDSD